MFRPPISPLARNTPIDESFGSLGQLLTTPLVMMSSPFSSLSVVWLNVSKCVNRGIKKVLSMKIRCCGFSLALVTRCSSSCRVSSITLPGAFVKPTSIPKYLYLSMTETALTLIPSMEMMSSGSQAHRFLLRSQLMFRVAHLLALTDSPQSSILAIILPTTHLRPRFVVAIITRSSANARCPTLCCPTLYPVSVSNTSVMHFITVLKRIGERGSPCFTPLPICIALEMPALVLRYVVLPVYRFRIYFKISDSAPQRCRQ